MSSRPRTSSHPRENRPASRETPLLQKGLDVLVLHPAAVEEAFPHRRPLAHRQKPPGKVAEEGGGLGVNEGDVAVGAGQVQPLPEPGDVPLQEGPPHLPLPGGEAFQVVFQQPGKLIGGVKELPGRGDGDPVQGVLPALGFGGEGGQGVDLVPPELHPHRLAPVRGPEVQDAPPDGELADPFHLAAPGIPRRQQPGHQLLLGQLLPRLQGKGPLPEHLRRGHRLHRGGGGGHGDGPRLPLEAAQHRQAQVLIFPADPLHFPQGQLPLGVVPGDGLPGKEVQVLAEAQGGLLVLGQHQSALPQAVGKSVEELCLVDLGRPGEEHRPPPPAEGLLHPAVFLPGGDEGINHGAPPPFCRCGYKGSWPGPACPGRTAPRWRGCPSRPAGGPPGPPG